MTVTELIKKLYTYPFDAKVLVTWEGTEHELDEVCLCMDRNGKILWIDAEEGNDITRDMLEEAANREKPKT